MVSLLLEIGLIIGIAAIISIIGRVIRQPPIVAYLITGVIAGPLFLKIVSPADTLQSLAHLGVALLLFIVGISLDFRVLKQLGGIAIVGGLATMAVVTTIMFFIAQALGFQLIAALYIALAFSFSSTVVVVKILSDKKEIDSLHGQIALGILIIEDFVAAIALMIIPVLAGGEAITIGLQISKALGLIAGVFIFGRFVFPFLLGIAAKSQEILFLFSIAWALIVSILFNAVGLSTEIGALIAGMVIASSKYSLEIKSKIKGVRDFFVILFFVFFGAQLAGPVTGSLIGKALLISIFILIGKPIIVMSFMRSFGFKKRTNFLAGTSLAQVSEFSLIVILLGFTLGHIPQEVFSLSILVALITIGISSYTMYFSHSIYEYLSRFLNVFDGKRHELSKMPKGENYDVLLLGYNRVGFNLLKAFTLAKKKYLIIDYNPI
ncbi:MAG: cation:proton antiporter, partial [Nanoarchaeota archaeon]